MKRITCLSLIALVVVMGLQPCFAGSPMVSPERAYVDAVIDNLVEVGLLTLEQAAQIKAEGVKAASEVAAQIAAEMAERPPKKAWYETTKVSGYAQGRWQLYPDAEAGAKSNEFVVRRARTKFVFKPTDRAQATIQVDYSSGKVTLKDAWLQYFLSDHETRVV